MVKLKDKTHFLISEKGRFRRPPSLEDFYLETKADPCSDGLEFQGRA
jgi:hypothetical protein